MAFRVRKSKDLPFLIIFFLMTLSLLLPLFNLISAITPSVPEQLLDLLDPSSKIKRSAPAANISAQDTSSDSKSPVHQNPEVLNPPLRESIYVPDYANGTVNETFFATPHRRDALRCAIGSPCDDGSCCSVEGKCGYGPTYCGSGNCTSQCDAKAMCGIYSEDDGTVHCGMKLCCSAMGWCGTTYEHCVQADPIGMTLPCQPEFGSCHVVPPPSCPVGGGTTGGRTVGYYQSWNVRNRPCGQVRPNSINTTSYTHLNFAFATIDPTTFQIGPADPDDIDLMKEFTNIHKTTGGRVDTFIAVGGFDFSDPDQPTHTTWSDMVSTASNRASFIDSAKAYMDTYGFQGIDLDWEYPGAPDRGGRKRKDTPNFVKLVQEMRAAYGSQYKISCVLAPDIAYLQYFDAIGMEPYVDFFGFMAYDLHGFWDAKIKQLGSLVRGQTDIRDIANMTLPLWFDGLNSTKINFGLAMYGRGYTLRDPACNSMLCPFSGPSKAGPCTNFDGVLSLSEIQQIIRQKGLTPRYNADAKMKEVTWDDQWMGYDDRETHAAKKAWADGKCFGGSMMWSVDFDSSDGSDNGGVVYFAPEVYSQRTAWASPTDQLVFPAVTLATPTTFHFPPLRTTFTVGGSIITTTITPPPVVTGSIEYSNSHGRSTEYVMVIEPSIEIPPMPVTVTDRNHQTTTTTLEFPPWPWAPETSASTITSPSPTTTPGFTFPPPGATSAKVDTDSTWPLYPHPSYTIPVQSPGTPPPIPTTTPPPTTTTSTEWLGYIEPITTSIDKPQPSDDSVVLPCDVWFFSLCIHVRGINIFGWKLHAPKGRKIGPGPPPPGFIRLPKSWVIHGELPDWPTGVFIGPDSKPTYPPEPDKACSRTKSAGVTATVTDIETIIMGTSTKTTTSTATETFVIKGPGCGGTPTEIDTTTRVCKTASPQQNRIGRDSIEHIAARAPPDPGCVPPRHDVFVIPKNPHNADKIRIRITEGRKPGFNLGHVEIRSPSLGFTLWFYVYQQLDDETENMEHWLQELGILFIDKWGEIVEKEGGGNAQANHQYNYAGGDQTQQINGTVGNKDDLDLSQRINQTLVNVGRSIQIGEQRTRVKNWGVSQISVPPNSRWYYDENYVHVDNGQQPQERVTFFNWADTTRGAGQFIYMWDDGVDLNHDAFKPLVDAGRVKALGVGGYGEWQDRMTNAVAEHGTGMAALACAPGYGQADQAFLVYSEYLRPKPGAYYLPNQLAFEDLLNLADDMKKNNREDTAVVLMARSTPTDFIPGYITVMHSILREFEKMGVPVIVATGNDAMVQGKEMSNDYPALFQDNPDTKLNNLIFVGATERNGYVLSMSQELRGGNTIWAPGHLIYVPMVGGGFKYITGTSPATAIVTGLIAYLRSLPSPTWRDRLKDVQWVKYLLETMSRRTTDTIPYPPSANNPSGSRKVPVVWNGQVLENSCLVNPNTPGCPWELGAPPDVCPVVKRDNSSMSNNDMMAYACSPPSEPPPSKIITYRIGSASPTCTGSCVPGRLCYGNHCQSRGSSSGTSPPYSPPPATTTNPFPTLDPTELPPNPVISSCASSTSTVECNGGPGHGGACSTYTTCLSWVPGAPLPTLEPTELPNPTVSSCASSTRSVECNGEPGLGGACITYTACLSWTKAPPLPTIPLPPKTTTTLAPIPTETPMPSCVYIEAIFTRGLWAQRMLVRYDSDTQWTEACNGGVEQDEAVPCRPEYSFSFHANGIGEGDLTANVNFPAGLETSFKVPQSKFDSSECVPVPGNPVGMIGCLEVTWTMNSCKQHHVPDWNEPEQLKGGHCCD